MSKNNFKPVTKQQKKIKVLAYCDAPVCATGFGSVSRNILQGLYNTGRYEIEILGINYWGDPYNFPAKIWPVGTNQERDPYGRKKICGMIPQMEYDILFFLQDTFILSFLPELMGHLHSQGKNQKSIVYFPIDGEPKEQWIHNVDACDHLVAYTDFGKEATKRVCPTVKSIQKITHGVNTSDYFVIDKIEVEAFRKQYFGKVADKFIFTSVARNQQRKDIPRTIAAFAEFRKQVKDSVLYLHCFAEGTDIRVFNGVKPIDKIKIDDIVLTKNGVFKRVYETSSRELEDNEHILELKVIGRNKGIVATSNHRFLAVKTEKAKCLHHSNECVSTCQSQWLYRKDGWCSNCSKREYESYEPEWVEAQNLKEGDYLIIPIIKNYIGNVYSDIVVSDIFDVGDQKYILDGNTIRSSNHPTTKRIPNIISVTEELMKLFGYYIAEGCVRGSMDTVQFTFHIKEKEYIDFVKKTVKDIFGLDVIDRKFPEKNVCQLTFCSTTFARLFKLLFGHSSHTKKYPEWFNFLDDKLFFGFMKGMFDGDGHYADTFVSYSTVSTDLVYMIKDGLLKREIFSSLRETYRPDDTFNGYALIIYADYAKFAKSINIKIKDKNRSVETSHFFRDGYLACRIYSIKKSNYNGKVYNMSVEEDESYCVNGFVAHNCAAKDQGWDLPEVVKSYDLNTTEDVILPQNFGPNQGYPRQIVNLIYNASDCVVSTATGEGWGNSWIESMAVKTPVIMPANTAFIENINEDNGYLVESGTSPSLFTTLPNDNEVQRPLVKVEDMVEKMLDVYNNPEEAKRRAENAYNWVTMKMDWQNNIVPQWVELFDKVYEEIQNGNDKVVEDDKIISTEKF